MLMKYKHNNLIHIYTLLQDNKVRDGRVMGDSNEESYLVCMCLAARFLRLGDIGGDATWDGRSSSGSWNLALKSAIH